MDSDSPIHEQPSKSKYFEILLRQLDPDREAAAQKYESIRRKLIRFFEYNSCLHAEELVDQTFDRVATILNKREIDDVATFIWGVAKKIRHESRRKAENIVSLSGISNAENSIPDARNLEQEIHDKMENELRAECLRRCIGKISDQNRRTFLAYFAADAAGRQRLAQELGITMNNLRVRMNRLRQLLETCVRNCHRSSQPNKLKQ
jgi:RNA polymerase sigma factor (sigma-70 family)